jgi:hypothetical protein
MNRLYRPRGVAYDDSYAWEHPSGRLITLYAKKANKYGTQNIVFYRGGLQDYSGNVALLDD